VALIADAYTFRALFRRRPGGLGAICWLVLPLTFAPTMWVRLDVFVAAALVGFVVAVENEPWRTAGACIAAATLLKLWPIVPVAVLWRIISRAGRRRLVASASVVLVAWVLPVVAWGGAGGLGWMLRYQATRGLEIESIWPLPAVFKQAIIHVRILTGGHGSIEVPIHGGICAGDQPCAAAALALRAWPDLVDRPTSLHPRRCGAAGRCGRAARLEDDVCAVRRLGVAATAIALDPCTDEVRRPRRGLMISTLAPAISNQVVHPLEWVPAIEVRDRGLAALSLHAVVAVTWLIVVVRWALGDAAVDVLGSRSAPPRSAAPVGVSA
jgi:hypothetical protein